MTAPTINELIAAHRPDHALQQGFYRRDDVYRRELERIFMKSWLYVGHASELPAVGDYLLFEIDSESVIVVRSAADEIRALVNVCRHRGSRICTERSGRERRFVCPYHGWTYGLDGSLRGAGQMDDSFDKSAYGLKRLPVEVFHGLIFVNFDPQPTAFAPVAGELDEPLRPYRLERAKVAHRQNYPLAANWKLAVENYCECYHCAPAHPEYTVAHGRALPEAQVREQLAGVMARSRRIGLTDHKIRHSWLDAGALGVDRGFERYPLLRGHLTGSRDGKPLAPLLGDLTGYDGGATDVHIGPMTFLLAYCDHVVVYRFAPRGRELTDCEISWLVKESAVEGCDYGRDELTWLWDVTTRADKTIIERNAAGVASRYYEPGPYAKMEDFTKRFVRWYLTVMQDGRPGAGRRLESSAAGAEGPGRRASR